MKNIIFAVLSLLISTSALKAEVIESPRNSYTVIKTLGAGVFGEVYEVVDERGEKFAIKWYRPQDDLEGVWGYLADSKREFNIGQQLNHPSIIRSVDYFSSFKEDGSESRYVVLEFVEGKTFFHIEPKSLDQTRLFAPAIELVLGLKNAFEQGLMHIDLHANNVMLSDEEHVKIIDLSSFFTISEIYNFKEESETALEKLALDDQRGPLRKQKLKKFFDENPQLKKWVADKKASDTLLPLGKMTKPEQEVYQFLKNYFYIRYLDIVTDACIYLVKKSNYSRDDEIELRAKIKSLAWNFEKDIEENIALPTDIYFDRLTALLEELQSTYSQ